ncbi:MAG: glycosyltransferase [Lachnospiraceae bacterium]|nr:glycosyltransferase [Lachnospiraceae bacterium]
MKFSIITICFNSESCIRKTIESVLSQDYAGDVEYIIIDGASKDKTVEIAESYRSSFENKGYSYIISSEPDKGIYDAMNKGIRRSSGDVVGIINSGDWYESIALSTVAEVYNDKPFDMFYADINLVRGDGSLIVKHSKQDKIITSRHWNHPTSFITRETYNELGLYRAEGIHDDFEFFLRVRRAKKEIVIRNVVLANFVTGGASNTKGFKKSINRIKDRYKCYRVNSYSPLYLLECIGIEVAKSIIS